MTQKLSEIQPKKESKKDIFELEDLIEKYQKVINRYGINPRKKSKGKKRISLKNSKSPKQRKDGMNLQKQKPSTESSDKNLDHSDQEKPDNFKNEMKIENWNTTGISDHKQIYGTLIETRQINMELYESDTKFTYVTHYPKVFA